MTKQEHLARAPIVEAVLAVSATLPDTVDQARLAGFQDRLGGQYPSKQTRVAWSSQIELKSDKPPVTRTSGGPVGYLFTSGDGTQVVQALKEGFAFSRLPPYPDWASFSQEALTLWGKFSEYTSPTKVNRVGLRFINRILLPLPIPDFKEYLLTVPEIAPELPQGLSSFLFRLVIPIEKAKATAIIIETIEDVDKGSDSLPLILDIDVFRVGALPMSADKLRPIFDQLCEIKDQVFFKSLTDKAKELLR